LVDINGISVVTYKYDAWGNIVYKTGGTIADINPYRYRGYRFDIETGFYYLQSRYYNPQIGRFISADGQINEGILGENMYAYAENNPVMYLDSMGDSPTWWNPFTWSNEAKIITGIVIIAGLAIATVATGGAAGGVAGFILAGALKGAAISAISGGLLSGTVAGLTSGSWEGFVDGFSTGFMTGAFIGGVLGAASNAFKVVKAAQSWAASSGKSSYSQMVSHYKNHVINEGQKHIAKNIVNYTRHANQFWASNSSNAYKIGVDAFKIAGGPGGIFTSSGLIKSFWYISL
jgi:RHS repeat-associated protein